MEAVHDITHRRRMIQCPRLPIFSSSIIDTEGTTYSMSRIAVKCIQKKERAWIVCFVGCNRNIEVVYVREGRKGGDIRREVRRFCEPYSQISGQHLSYESQFLKQTYWCGGAISVPTMNLQDGRFVCGQRCS